MNRSRATRTYPGDRRIALAAALVVVVVAPSARAQTSPVTEPAATSAQAAPRDAARAAELFERAVAAIDRGAWDAAIADLERSFELRAVPTVLLNLGIAYRGAGRFADAIAALERYLALGGDAISRERDLVVRNTLRELRASLGWLRIASEPPGARVRIDGRAAGGTPMADAIALSAGIDHRFELELRGHVRIDETVRLLPGERRAIVVRLPGVETAATLALVGDGTRGAHVAIDGIDVGAPPVERTVEAGGHRIEAAAPGASTIREEVVLAPLERRVVSLRFAHPPGAFGRPAFWIATSAVVAAAVAVVAIVLVATADPFAGTQEIHLH